MTLLSPPPENSSILKLIGWWELRRIPYNLVMLPIAFASFILTLTLVPLYQDLGPGEDAVEPFMMLVGPIFMNICYTLGWFVHLLGVPPSAAPRLFKLGFLFSLAIVSFPGLAHIFFYILS